MLSYYPYVPLGEQNFTLDTGLCGHYSNNIADWDELELLDGGNIVVPQSPGNGGGNPHDQPAHQLKYRKGAPEEAPFSFLY